MSMNIPFGASASEGMEYFRRAVLRAPPARFTIEFLDMAKDGGSNNLGMRIHPVIYEPSLIASKSSIISQSSIVSRSSIISHRAYDIQRRWEDCLRFQETLEKEYARAAQEKKLRLLQGKGVKGFNGVYKHDLASSWDSLPAGPDPKSIAQDIHQHLPTLTRRNSIFRPNPATVERRRKELQALVEALFSDEMPALIQEIRATDIVTDFFGVWRRDHDQALKRHSDPQSSTSSTSNSIFDSYFSTSNPSLNGSYIGKSSASLSSGDRPRTSSGVSSRRLSDQSHPSTTRTPRRRTSSAISSDSSSGASEISYENRSSRSPTTGSSNGSLTHHNSPHTPNERPGLDALPEEPEMSNKSLDKFATFNQRRPGTTESKGDRGRQFARPLTAGSKQSKPAKDPGGRPVQEIRQKRSTSVDAVKESMGGLNLSLANAMKEQIYCQPMASISAFILADPADSSPSRSPATPTSDTELGVSRPRILIPVSPPSPGIPSDIDDHPPSLISDRSRYPKTPAVPGSPASPNNDVLASPVSSLAPSRFSTSTFGSSLGSINLKVAHEGSIIVLRVPWDVSFADVRDKVYNKFVNQEGVPLSETFSIGLAPKLDDPTNFQPLKDNVDWERLISATTGTKLNLRVYNSTA